MASILPAIKFKTLIDQLNDDEFDKLLLKFRERIGRDEIVRMMWDTVYHSNRGAIEGEILSIMQQRNPEDGNECDATAMVKRSITTLPTTMIGEIASYLDQKAYARFSTTNRKMFVDCNSPNRLVSLNLGPVVDFNFISMANYRYLTSLEFAVADIDDFDYRQMFRCRRLRTLMITGEQDGAVEDLSRFIDDIDGAFTGVTTLALYGFMRLRQTNLRTSLPPKLVAQLLALFPALTHLKLYNVHFTDNLDTALLANCCPSLNRLSMNVIKQETSILNAYGRQITTLALSSRLSGPVPIPPNLDYSNLRRLCLYGPSQNSMNCFLKTSRNLEEICFVPLKRFRDSDVQLMSDLEIKRMTKALIVDFKSIKFIHISTRGHFESICNSIHQGLFCTINRRRKFMEIGLTVDCREITDFNEFMCSISRIIVGLAQSETEKWILSLQANQHRSFGKNRDSVEQAVSAFMSSHKTLNVELLFAGEWKYVFGSSGCSFMDKHRDWWNDCWKIDFY